MNAVFNDYSDKVLQALEENCEKALEEIGLTAERFAKEELTEQGAVDTGALRNSVSHLVEASEKAVYIGSPLEYATYVEMGTGQYVGGGRPTPWAFQDSNGNWYMTSGMKPRPFIKPVATEHTEEYRSIVEKNMKE